MERRTISVESAPKAIGPYCQGLCVSGSSELFYFSGMLPIEPGAGKIVAQTVKEQTQQIIKNIDNLITSQGLTNANIIKTTVFITDMGTFAEMNGVYAEYFSTNPPARSCVEVSKLPLGALVEIEVIAAK